MECDHDKDKNESKGNDDSDKADAQGDRTLLTTNMPVAQALGGGAVKNAGAVFDKKSSEEDEKHPNSVDTIVLEDEKHQNSVSISLEGIMAASLNEDSVSIKVNEEFMPDYPYPHPLNIANFTELTEPHNNRNVNSPFTDLLARGVHPPGVHPPYSSNIRGVHLPGVHPPPYSINIAANRFLRMHMLRKMA